MGANLSQLHLPQLSHKKGVGKIVCHHAQDAEYHRDGEGDEGFAHRGVEDPITIYFSLFH